MGLSSIHVCMDSPDHWLQGTIHEESGMDSSSSPSAGDMMLTCSTRPGSSGGAAGGMMERRLRPPHHDQAQKCPRCDSTHTKFCYYNNYSLSQPRYFCKTCRRYWTKGGTLRNIPVGGGCRKNKKVSSNKKSSSSNINNNNNDSHNSNLSNNNQQSQLALNPNLYHHSPKDLQISFPDVQLSHLTNFLGANGGLGNPNFMLDHSPRPIEFMMESKLEGIIGSASSSRNFDFFGNGGDNIGMATVGLGDDHNSIGVLQPHSAFHGFAGMSLNDQGGGSYMMDSSSCQRLMLPYDHHHHHHHHGGGEEHDNNAQIDVKPNPKLLSLEWQQQDQHSGKEINSFGYLNGSGSWSGMINGYGSSTTNPLV